MTKLGHWSTCGDVCVLSVGFFTRVMGFMKPSVLSFCGWFTYSSDRDSVLSSGRRKPCRVPGGNHTLLRSLLLLCTFPRHRRCRSGTLAEHHCSGNGRKRGETQFLKLNQRMRGVTYICRVRNYGFKQRAVFQSSLSSYFASHSCCLVTQVLSLAVDSDIVYAAVEGLGGTVRPGTQT